MLRLPAPHFQSSLNEAYWEVVDHAISEAKRLGITVMICTAYLGFSETDGWHTEMAAASDANMTTYGTTVATRYADYGNILWLVGHDREPDATDVDRQEALTAALRANSDYLVTFGGLGNIVPGSSYYPTITADFDTIYNYSYQPAEVTEEIYAAAPIPVGWFEGHYEADYDNPNEYNDEPWLRSQMWGPFCGGACYVYFGNSPIWHFETATWAPDWSGTWESNLDSPGSLKLEVFASFVAGLGDRWATMLPLGSTFATTGRGADDLLVAARVDTAATTGTVAVVYRPDGGAATIGLDLGALAPTNVEVFKFDPVSAAATSLGTFATSGSQSFGSLGTNSAGDGDWVLTVEAV